MSDHEREMDVATPTTIAAPAAARLRFNPRTYDGAHLDPEARRLMLATIEFFESRGKGVLKQQDRDRVWCDDFLEFIAREASSTEVEQAWALEHVRKPVVGEDRFTRVWDDVRALAGAYEMQP